MKLESKTSLLISGAFIISGLVVFILFNHLILREFEILENQKISQNTSRVVEALQQEVRALQVIAKDQAMWDDAYEFVQDPNQEFIRTNLTYEPIHLIDARHFGFLNADLELAYGVQLDASLNSTEPLSEAAKQQLVTSKIFKDVIRDKKTVTGGFITIGDKQYIVAASPITDSAISKNPAGILFVTRELNRDFIKRLSNITKIDLTTTIPSQPKEAFGETQLIDALSAISNAGAIKNPQKIIGTLYIKDLHGAPFLTLQTHFIRDIYNKGLDARAFFGLMMSAVCLFACLVVISLVRRLILNPIALLEEQLRQITATGDFKSRMKVATTDEIGELSLKINDTLQTLDEALTRAESSQHQAEAANLAKSAFIAKVSHELRTPIHSITGMLRILLKEERSSAKRNYILMARNAAYGLLETINEILDFSKTEADKLTLEKIEFSIHDVIRDAVQTVGPRVEEKGSLEVLVSVPQALPDTVIGDPLRIKQVLVNLLGNATKFTKQGEIGVYVTPVTNENNLLELEIAISDTGIGIPTDRLEHIFEPFSQADESVSRMFTGTGLGLTLVKQFIEAMDGTVRVESELGVGSRFILNLPFQVPTKAKPVVYRPKLGCNRIVLIDGSSASVALCLKELQDNGYAASLIASDNSEELLRLTRELTSEEQPHSTPPYGLVIVTSEALKRSRVFDLVVELRNNSAVPVVSILSPFEISVRERLLALNVPFVVTRPISLLDILGVISGELELSQEGWEDCEEQSLNTSRTLEILVADDAQTNRIILTELLREAGHRVVCVENGVELVSQIKDSLEGAKGSQSFDIILTDVQMPLLDGLNATAQIRSLERKHGVIKHLPIIAVTAHAMTDETSRMRNFGIDDVVTKPLDPLRLGEVLQKLTGQKIASDIRAGSNGEAETQRAATNRKAPLSEREFCDLALRLWTQMAKRDSDLRETFSLEDDPLDPKVFKGVLDINDVYERSGDSVRRTLLIFSGFGDCFREQLQRLSDGKQSRDLNDIRFGAHALKGLLLDVGAKASADLACRIEQLALKGEADKAVALISQLTKQVLLISRLVAQITNSAGEGASGDGNTRASRDSGAQKYEVREQ